MLSFWIIMIQKRPDTAAAATSILSSVVGVVQEKDGDGEADVKVATAQQSNAEDDGDSVGCFSHHSHLM